LGDDSLASGAGDDVFEFAPGDGQDEIDDFEDGGDLLDVSAYNVANSSGFAITGNGTTSVTVDFGGGYQVTASHPVDTITITDADFVF
jgi:hypothetical protein